MPFAAAAAVGHSQPELEPVVAVAQIAVAAAAAQGAAASGSWQNSMAETLVVGHNLAFAAAGMQPAAAVEPHSLSAVLE